MHLQVLTVQLVSYNRNRLTLLKLAILKEGYLRIHRRAAFHFRRNIPISQVMTHASANNITSEIAAANIVELTTNALKFAKRDESVGEGATSNGTNRFGPVHIKFLDEVGLDSSFGTPVIKIFDR